MPETLAEKVWNSHVVRPGNGAAEPDLLYIDLHLVHEVTSPQAFEGLRLAGRRVRRPDLTIATADHNVPTTTARGRVEDPVSRRQLEALDANCAEFGVTCYPMGDANQGIVHVIGPEQGLTQPGMTIVCGDSHTSTHGAFGALAFGIGTSEVEHVLATQTLPQRRPRTMAVTSGPRSEQIELVNKFQKELPFYRGRLFVRPGLTGWAQINQRYASTVEDTAVKLEFDLYYIKHRNPMLDATILIRTVGAVIGFKGL